MSVRYFDVQYSNFYHCFSPASQAVAQNATATWGQQAVAPAATDKWTTAAVTAANEGSLPQAAGSQWTATTPANKKCESMSWGTQVSGEVATVPDLNHLPNTATVSVKETVISTESQPMELE